MNNRILNTIILVFISTTFQGQIDPNLSDQLQQILNQRVLWNGDHGVSATVIMPDGSVWNGYAGVGADDVQVTDSMVFHGASTMKMNIAVLMVPMCGRRRNGSCSRESSGSFASRGTGTSRPGRRTADTRRAPVARTRHDHGPP